MNKISYSTKEKICIYISNLKKKHIANEDILAAEAKFAIPTAQHDVILRAWTNFVQTGGKTVDRRIRNKSNKTTVPTVFNCKPTIKGCWKYNDSINFDDAKKIIREYMTTKISSRGLSEKHNISVNQFYDWIRELEVSGTLLGEKILNPKKYAKVTVVDVIWLRKHPKTTRKTIRELSVGEREYLERVGEVLETYLI